MKDKKVIVWQNWLLSCAISKGSNRVAIELQVMQLWSQIILVISNRRFATVGHVTDNFRAAKRVF